MEGRAQRLPSRCIGCPRTRGPGDQIFFHSIAGRRQGTRGQKKKCKKNEINTSPLQKASIFLLIFVPTGTACSNPLLAKSYLTANFATGKRSTSHYSTCVAKSQCLGLSSGLGHRWGCLLIPTAKSYSTANYAKKAKQCKPP